MNNNKTVDIYQTEHLINSEKIKKLQNTFSLKEWSKKYKINISKYSDKQKNKLSERLKKNPFFYMKGVELNLEKLDEKVSDKISNKTGFSKETIAKQKEEFDEFLKSKEEFIKKIVGPEKLSLTSIEKAKKEATKKVEQKVEEVKDKATKAVLEKTGIGAVWEKLNGIFDKIGETFTKYIDKIFIALGIGAIFGTDKEEDKPEENTVENEEDMSTEKIQKQLEKEGKVETKLDLEKEDEKKTNTNSEVIDTKKVKYLSSIKTMLSLSLIKTDKQNYENGVLKNIQNKSYNDVIEKKVNIEGNKDSIEKIIEQLKSKQFTTIANYNFQHKFLKDIIYDNDGTINKKLADNVTGGENRLKDILVLAKNGNKDWWKELSIGEISLLYLNSFNVLKLPKFDNYGVKGLLGTLLFNNSKLEDDVEKNGNFISKNIISNFAKNYEGGFGGNEKVQAENDTEILENVGKNLTSEEKAQLEDIIRFKNNILNNYASSFKPELTETQQKLFKEHIDYRGIISLYSLMGGKDYNPENINITNKFSLAYLNSIIIGGLEGQKYIGNILYKIATEDTNLFTEEEMEVLGIYKDKALDFSIGYKLKEIAKALGFTSGITNTDLDKLAIGLGVGGLGLKILGGKLIAKKLEKKGISIIGMFAKKLGWLGILSGLAIGGYSFYNKEHIKGDDLKKDLDNSLNNNKEIDAKKLLEVLEKYKNSIYEKNIDGKNIRIIKYGNDTPLVLIDNKIYTFDITDDTDNIKEIIDKFEADKLKSWYNIGNYIKNSVLDWISEKNGKTEVNGHIIDSSNIKITEGNYIEIGTGNNTKKYSITELFNGLDNKQTKIHKDLRKIIQYKYPERKFIWGNGEEFSFIELDNLGDGKTLSLVEIGDLNKKTEN